MHFKALLTSHVKENIMKFDDEILIHEDIKMYATSIIYVCIYITEGLLYMQCMYIYIYIHDILYIN